MKKKLPKILVILGPTATGKSDLAVKIAQKFNGEVLSADSRQVYRGLDIGAGKITHREMKGVPHHLLDIANPKGERYNVDDFKRDAARAIDGILAKDKLPIICGGTGFYIDALVRGEEFPSVPPNKKLRTKLQKESAVVLMRKLQKLDACRAKQLDPSNKVRLIRAIEIATALGTVPKVKHSQQYDPLWIGLTTDRDHLRERIRARILKRMQGDKMIKEVKILHKKGLSWKRLYEFGLEYRYIALYLQKKIDKETMIKSLENDTCDFSKRQMRWFKRNPDIMWFEMNSGQSIERIIKKSLS